MRKACSMIEERMEGRTLAKKVDKREGVKEEQAAAKK